MKKLIKSIFLPVFEWYFRMRMARPIWLHGVNGGARRLWRKQAGTLDNVQKRIVRDLSEQGIAVVHIDELIPGSAFRDCVEHTASLREQRKKQEPLENAKVSKPFLASLFEPNPVIDFKNPFHRCALNARVVDIVNAYLGVYAKLYYLTLNVTLPVGEGQTPVASQRWHRDPEDRKMCKVFLYLNDVDERAGPFTYVTKSCYGLKYGSLFPQKPPIGVYPDANVLEAKIDKSDIKVCTGRAGTIIFCDTSGLHKGGFAETHERIMFTAGYRTNGAVTPNRIRYPEGHAVNQDVLGLAASVRYAATPFSVSRLNRKLFSYTQRWKEELLGKNAYHEG